MANSHADRVLTGRLGACDVHSRYDSREVTKAAREAFPRARRRFDGKVIPWAIITDPPLGVAGLTEAEVRAMHHPAVCATTPLEYVVRAGAIQKTSGLAKFHRLDDR